MDLKAIIGDHADVVARKNGTSWDEVVKELRQARSGCDFDPKTRETMSQVYRLSILTNPRVLKHIYGFKILPRQIY